MAIINAQDLNGRRSWKQTILYSQIRVTSLFLKYIAHEKSLMSLRPCFLDRLDIIWCQIRYVDRLDELLDTTLLSRRTETP